MHNRLLSLNAPEGSGAHSCYGTCVAAADLYSTLQWHSPVVFPVPFPPMPHGQCCLDFQVQVHKEGLSLIANSLLQFGLYILYQLFICHFQFMEYLSLGQMPTCRLVRCGSGRGDSQVTVSSVTHLPVGNVGREAPHMRSLGFGRQHNSGVVPCPPSFAGYCCSSSTDLL